MPHATKIATCCYCGTRAALVLKGKERHELACASCGAPLHDMKQMPLRVDTARSETRRSHPRPQRKPKAKPKKRRKSLGRRLLEEAWDVVEDIFD